MTWCQAIVVVYDFVVDKKTHFLESFLHLFVTNVHGMWKIYFLCKQRADAVLQCLTWWFRNPRLQIWSTVYFLLVLTIILHFVEIRKKHYCCIRCIRLLHSSSLLSREVDMQIFRDAIQRNTSAGSRSIMKETENVRK